MTNSQKAAIEEAVKLPTAEQLLSDTYKKHGWRYQPNIVGGCPHEHIALEAMQSYSDQQNAELREQLTSEIESREHWQRQTQRYQKYHRELNAALERVKELEAWKESASTVLNELDLQSLGQKLGIKLGESISKQLPGKVDALKAENERYRKALEDVIIRLGEDKRFNALSIAKEALKHGTH